VQIYTYVDRFVLQTRRFYRHPTNLKTLKGNTTHDMFASYYSWQFGCIGLYRWSYSVPGLDDHLRACKSLWYV